MGISILTFLFLKFWRCFFISTNSQEFLKEKDDTLINEAIRFKELRLISAEGEQLGIMSARDAQKIAREKELDLVCVAPMAKPPVCKIMNYGKYRYEQQRHEREAKKNQKVVEIKEIRMTPVIDTHDFDTKVRNARKFIENGDKVLLTVRFKGRMITNTSLGEKVLKDFATACEDIAKIESETKLDNKQMSITLAQIPQKKK